MNCSKTPTGNYFPLFFFFFRRPIFYFSQACNNYDFPELKQAIQPMLSKVLAYQSEALKKPVYLCSETFDPDIKPAGISPPTLSAAGLANQTTLIEYLTIGARCFEIPADPGVEVIYPPSSDEDEDQHQHSKSRNTPILAANKFRQYLLIPE